MITGTHVVASLLPPPPSTYVQQVPQPPGPPPAHNSSLSCHCSGGSVVRPSWHTIRIVNPTAGPQQAGWQSRSCTYRRCPWKQRRLRSDVWVRGGHIERGGFHRRYLSRRGTRCSGVGVPGAPSAFACPEQGAQAKASTPCNAHTCNSSHQRCRPSSLQIVQELLTKTRGT